MHGGIVWSLDHARIKHLEEHLLLISGRPPPSLQALQPHLLPRPPIIHYPPRSPTLVTRLSYEGSYSPSLLFFYFLSLSSTRSPTFIIYLCVISFDLPPLPIATKLSKGREKVTHTHTQKKRRTLVHASSQSHSFIDETILRSGRLVDQQYLPHHCLSYIAIYHNTVLVEIKS